jgi:hypothetical protein
MFLVHNPSSTGDLLCRCHILRRDLSTGADDSLSLVGNYHRSVDALTQQPKHILDEHSEISLEISNIYWAPRVYDYSKISGIVVQGKEGVF